MLFLNGIAFAQVPEDALRFSWQPIQGSARYMAIGGTMGSLGGDITAAFVNPAGLGLFKTKEFSFAPAFNFRNNNIFFRDSTRTSKKNSFGIGPMGVIIGMPDPYNKSNSSAFCIALNQNASFNNNYSYSGFNNYSSFSEQFVEEFARSGQSINNVLTTNSPLPFTAAPALYTYLIDTVTIDGTTQIKGAPEYILDSGGILKQDMTRVQRGDHYELAFSYASNINEKWLYGVTIGVPIIVYSNKSTFTESDATGDTANRFDKFTYIDDFSTNGIGFNSKFGVIYRPKEYIRFGLALHTPSFMSLADNRTTSLTTTLENPGQTFTVSSNTFTNGQAGESNYSLNMPWRAIISGSYVFREIQDVRKQKAFISADIEYIRHRASRFRSSNETPTQDEKNYFTALNNVMKSNYKSTFNFRLGGELKFDVIMIRGGLAYYGNPYKDPELKGNQLLLSGGLGYRNHGFFVDLTYVQNMKRDTDFPYRLSDRLNTFASTRITTGQLMCTIGFKF